MPETVRRLGAEAAGTFGIVFIGCGAITLDAAGHSDLGRAGVGVTFGVAVAAMILAFGRLSGAHLNPAVSVGLWGSGALRGRSLPPYLLAQLAGASVAAGTLHLLFPNLPGDLGATVPAGSVWESFGLEMVFTFALVSVILALACGRAAPLPIIAVAAGAVIGLEATFGAGISGASMNPARSFGPALAAWTWGNHWIYWLAPITGAGAAVALHCATLGAVTQNRGILDRVP